MPERSTIKHSRQEHSPYGRGSGVYSGDLQETAFEHPICIGFNVELRLV